MFDLFPCDFEAGFELLFLPEGGRCREDGGGSEENGENERSWEDHDELLKEVEKNVYG